MNFDKQSTTLYNHLEDLGFLEAQWEILVNGGWLRNHDQNGEPCIIYDRLGAPSIEVTVMMGILLAGLFKSTQDFEKTLMSFEYEYHQVMDKWDYLLHYFNPWQLYHPGKGEPSPFGDGGSWLRWIKNQPEMSGYGGDFEALRQCLIYQIRAYGKPTLDEGGKIWDAVGVPPYYVIGEGPDPSLAWVLGYYSGVMSPTDLETIHDHGKKCIEQTDKQTPDVKVFPKEPSVVNCYDIRFRMTTKNSKVPLSFVLHPVGGTVPPTDNSMITHEGRDIALLEVGGDKVEITFYDRSVLDHDDMEVAMMKIQEGIAQWLTQLRNKEGK